MSIPNNNFDIKISLLKHRHTCNVDVKLKHYECEWVEYLPIEKFCKYVGIKLVDVTHKQFDVEVPCLAINGESVKIETVIQPNHPLMPDGTQYQLLQIKAIKPELERLPLSIKQYILRAHNA